MSNFNRLVEANFWWGPPSDVANLMVGLGHTEPLGPHDDLGDLFQSFDQVKRPSTESVLYRLGFLNEWSQFWKNENIYRSLTLFDSEGQPARLGPFYLDIDAELNSPEGSLDLIDAANVAQNTVAFFMNSGVSESDIRIWFSGHKGFNVEVRPEAIALDSADPSNTIAWGEKLVEVRNALRSDGLITDPAPNVVSSRGTVLDNVFSRFWPHLLNHKHLRLGGSKNVWLEANGSKRARLKMPVSFAELQSIPILSIATDAERQAKA